MIQIDPLSEDCLTLTEAAKLMPRRRNNAKPHLSTLIRWVIDGAPSRDGRRVRLSAIRCGGRWLTSRAALREFYELLTPKLEPSLPAPMTPTKRKREDERTEKVLHEEQSKRFNELLF